MKRLWMLRQLGTVSLVCWYGLHSTAGQTTSPASGTVLDTYGGDTVPPVGNRFFMVSMRVVDGTGPAVYRAAITKK